MSLPINKLIRDLSKLAFTMTLDVQRSGIFRQVRGSSYNSETGYVTPAQVDAVAKFIIAPYRQDEIDGVLIKFGDERVVIRLRDLHGIDEVTANDLVLVTGEQPREIVSFTLDPTKQMAILQCRKLARLPEGGSS